MEDHLREIEEELPKTEEDDYGHLQEQEELREQKTQYLDPKWTKIIIQWWVQSQTKNEVEEGEEDVPF